MNPLDMKLCTPNEESLAPHDPRFFQCALCLDDKSPPKKTMCHRCSWRHVVLPSEDDESSESEHDDDEYSNPVRHFILRGLHADPPEIWTNLLNTKTLAGGSVIRRETSFAWFRIPIRKGLNDRNMLGQMPFAGDKDYQIEGIQYDRNAVMGPVYHNTQLKHLVQRNHLTSQESSGIFRDGGFFWGTGTRNAKSGVNFNAGHNGGACSNFQTSRNFNFRFFLILKCSN